MDSKEKEQFLKLAEHYFRNNNHSFAKPILEKILKTDSNNSKANELLAYIHENLGNTEISFELLVKTCSQGDCSFEALYYLGSAQLERGFFNQAIENFKKSILKGGEFFEALHDLATAQAQLGDLTSAINNYQKCLKFGKPSHELFYNIARIYDDLKQFNEAISHYDKALSLKNDFAEAWSNKGAVLQELKRYDEAISQYDKALSLKPDIDWAYGDLLFTKIKMCKWLGLEDSLEAVYKKVYSNERVISPFGLLAVNDDMFLHKKSSEIYTQYKYPFNPILGPIVERSGNQKIRVGYFSADFHNHATGYLIAELFELHDKSQFELIGFSFGPIKNDEMRQRLVKSFDQFIEVRHQSDIEIAQLSRSLHIDIAVDLNGFTQDARTGIFSYRAAPIQVNYLGYPGTMATNYVDYIVADKTLIQLESQSCYSEKVVYLPHSYQVNDRKRLISEKRFTKQELGLPENGFVFCCFNNNYKITPSTFVSWMRILKAVEGSVLWLFQDNPWVVVNLKIEASKQGIDASRLVFAEQMSSPEHLARQRQADLFLDTFPYNAHTTASDALWVGLPVITLQGKSFASRVAASLLDAIGLPELVTNSQEEYETLAIDLALNHLKYADFKLKLANNRLTTPLFDTPLFTKNLEAAYIKMYQQYQAKLEPDHIFII